MSTEVRYQYGWSAARLIAIALASALGAGICYFVATDAPPRQVGAPHDAAVLALTAIALAGVVLYQVYLLVRRIAFPQFIVLDEATLCAPKNGWGPQTQFIRFADVQKIVGPRAGKLELRGNAASLFLEQRKFNSAQEFQACCAEVARRCGLASELAPETIAPVGVVTTPEYVELGKSFSTARLTTFYGSVIASADALFLIRLKNHPAKYKWLTEGVSTAFERLGGKKLIEMPISELPPAILDHKDWPLWDADGTVRVVPKTLIRSVRCPWWGAFAFRTDGHCLKVSVPWWKTARLRRQLRELGWT